MGMPCNGLMVFQLGQAYDSTDLPARTSTRPHMKLANYTHAATHDNAGARICTKGDTGQAEQKQRGF